MSKLFLLRFSFYFSFLLLFLLLLLDSDGVRTKMERRRNGVRTAFRRNMNGVILADFSHFFRHTNKCLSSESNSKNHLLLALFMALTRCDYCAILSGVKESEMIKIVKVSTQPVIDGKTKGRPRRLYPMLRIGAPSLREAGFGIDDEVEVEVEPGKITIREV